MFKFHIKGELVAADEAAVVAAWVASILPTAPADIVRWLNGESVEIPWIDKVLGVLDALDAGEAPIAPSTDLRSARAQVGRAIRNDPNAERIDVVTGAEAERIETAALENEGPGEPTTIALVTPQGRARRSAIAFFEPADPTIETSVATSLVISPAPTGIGFDVTLSERDTDLVTTVSKGPSGTLHGRVTKNNAAAALANIVVDVEPTAGQQIVVEVTDVVVDDDDDGNDDEFPVPLSMKKGVGTVEFGSRSLRLRLKGRVRFAKFSHRLLGRFWPVGRFLLQRSARKSFAQTLAGFDAKVADSPAWAELVELARQELPQ